MPLDPSGPFAVAAQRRRGQALERARTALRDLDQHGHAVSFKPSPATPASRGSGSTPNPSSEPRSNASATATQRPRDECPTPNAPARPRCASAMRRSWPRTSDFARRRPNCVTSSRCFTVSAAKHSRADARSFGDHCNHELALGAAGSLP
jgi:hypothetical protein